MQKKNILDINPLFEISKACDLNSLKMIESVVTALWNTSIITISDNNSNLLYVNKNFCKLSKYEFDELVGKNFSILNSRYHNSEFFENMKKKTSAGNSWTGEIKNLAKDGTFFWI